VIEVKLAQVIVYRATVGVLIGVATASQTVTAIAIDVARWLGEVCDEILDEIDEESPPCP
jgi:hypothetical protein